MAQEFTIKSQDIEDKINQLLPSQGGFQPGVDFSASTMVIPIVDLTETAEGSSLRQDLQRSFSFTSSTVTITSNATNTLVNTTGYYRVFYSYVSTGSPGQAILILNDGTTDKFIVRLESNLSGSSYYGAPLTGETDVFLRAGDSLKAFSNAGTSFYTTTRQIADINGNLINP